jgi:hypothetical protein
MVETFTDSLRRRLLEASQFCPTCEQPMGKGGLRAFSEKIGIGPTVLWHFLKGDAPSAATIDAIVAFLGPER